MAEYLLAHDLGTSANKAVLCGLDGRLHGSIVSAYPTVYPQDRWVEQRADDWWKAVCQSTYLLLEQTGVDASDIAAVSFSGQMMGCLLVDRDGNPLRNMIIWADTRSNLQEKRMIEAVGMDVGYQITGHRLSASYSAAKLLWVRDNEPEIYRHTYKMLHAKDYIIFRMTGEFASEYSDASSTNLFDIQKKRWSNELIKDFGIRPSILPDLYPSTYVIGTVTATAAQATGLCEGTPVVMGGGDGSCACVGAGVVEVGSAYNILGSSSWISFASNEPYFDDEMRTFNFVHLDSNLYTPTGTMQAAGYSYSWYRDMLCNEERRIADKENKSVYQLIDAGVSRSKPGAGGMLYLPYLLGERSPRWNHKARGAFIGMTISTTKDDFARAILEGVGYNLKVILDIFDLREPIKNMLLIGGGAKGEVWQQILADIWQKPLMIPEYLEEATSIGAAVCAGVGIGAYSSFSATKDFNRVVKTVYPNPENFALYQRMYRAFNEAYYGIENTYELLW